MAHLVGSYKKDKQQNRQYDDEKLFRTSNRAFQVSDSVNTLYVICFQLLEALNAFFSPSSAEDNSQRAFVLVAASVGSHGLEDDASGGVFRNLYPMTIASVLRQCERDKNTAEKHRRRVLKVLWKLRFMIKIHNARTPGKLAELEKVSKFHLCKKYGH